jgi:tetratricopeptide (TPR) repeat protein
MRAACATAFVVACASSRVFAEKTLMYDEEKGIIFVDKDQKQAKQETSEKSFVKKNPSQGQIPASKNVDNGLIRGKKKDPAAMYFESGLQYFKAGNYDDALRQFIHADSIDPQPVYDLWIGKTYRQLGKGDQVLFIMKRILTTYPDSAVAADALFEIGFYCQTSDDYAGAAATYTRLSEQYPFAKSYSNGEEFREVAKRLKQMMRSEMISTLKILGYQGDEPEDLVRNFQKSKGFQVTGAPDRKTVTAVKQEYREYQKNEAKKAAARTRAARYMKWTAGLSGLCLLCLTAMIFARMSAVNRIKHLTALSQSLDDLDMRNL